MSIVCIIIIVVRTSTGNSETVWNETGWIFSLKYTICDLFTMFTYLFTIQITQSEKYQTRFAESILNYMKHMKKNIYVLILPLIVVSGLVIANREIKDKTRPSPKPLSGAGNKAPLVDERKKWEDTPDGRWYKEWENSPAGKKVYASHDKIKKDIKTFSNMEAVVTSVTFRRTGKSSGIKWLIVRINGEEYMMQFSPKEFQQLNSLKVNDNIILRSRSAGYSPNHPNLIISGDYIERNSEILFKRDFSKIKGC